MPRHRYSQEHVLTFLLVFSFLLAQPALAWVSRPPPLRAIFSDIDGTLVHYASDFERFGVKLVESDEAKLTAVVEGPNGDRRKCRLLPSLTMGPACVSLRTIELVDALRSHGVLFCVVTAARKSTMLARQPLLPVCDVHVCESGSRIVVGEQLDTAFAERFEQITGPLDRELDVSERPEALWAFFRLLQSSVPGLKCDARSYYGCFRVNTKGDAAIDARLHEVIVSSLPSGISWSMNLGKYDFYPAVAGKGNAVAHLQTRFGVERAGSAHLATIFDKGGGDRMKAKAISTSGSRVASHSSQPVSIRYSSAFPKTVRKHAVLLNAAGPVLLEPLEHWNNSIVLISPS